MAHLWIQSEDRGWVAHLLEGPKVFLAAGGPLPRDAVDCAVNPGADATLAHTTGVQPPEWVLVAGAAAAIAVNGIPEPLGLRVLADRDEIRMGGGSLTFFSSEECVMVQPFPGAGHAVECPRCRQEIAKGTPAVRCPGLSCGIWYHQSSELPCYTYAEKCARCPRKTALDGGFEWMPEES